MKMSPNLKVIGLFNVFNGRLFAAMICAFYLVKWFLNFTVLQHTKEASSTASLLLECFREEASLKQASLLKKVMFT